MSNIELTEEMLKSNGWAYLFDLAVVQNLDDGREVHEHIRNIYQSAIEALFNQRSKKLKKGPFLLWNCLTRLLGNNNQPVDGYVLFITPFYHEITGRDSEPVVEEMRKHTGYIRTSSASPIMEGAVPSCLYEDGQAYPIELDQSLITRLSEAFEEHQYLLSAANPGMSIRSNPYEN